MNEQICYQLDSKGKNQVYLPLPALALLAFARNHNIKKL